jgi:hypothetical protein
MTKETPITLDQITIETLRILETDLAFKRNMTRRDDENDSSPMRIRMPQVTYTPPPPKPPYLALAALALSAALAFASLWAAIAWVFIL